MTSRWYLVQAEIEATVSDIIPDLVKGEYYCTFLAKHPSDVKNSNNCSCYWPDWYCYLRDSVSNNIVFVDRVLFRPNITPDHNKYIQWVNRV